MKESTRNWIQFGTTTLVALGWSAFDRRHDLIPLIESCAPLVSGVVLPIGYMLIGFSFGFATCKRIEIRDRRKSSNPFGTKRAETTYTRVEMEPEAMEKAKRAVERKALEMRVNDLEGKEQ